MRNYSVTDYPKNEKALFNFLIEEYGFQLIKRSQTDFSYLSEYQKQDIRIVLNYDYKDNLYYFTLIRGVRTKFPNDQDNENIKPLIALFQKYEPNIDARILAPDDKQCLEALQRTAILLKKYGDKILKGQEWC